MLGRGRLLRRRPLPALLLAGALTLALAGCGADSGPDAAGGPGPASGPATATGTDAGSSRPTPTSAAPLLTFTATTVDGRPFDGTSLAGKPTALWFWAPWCSTCLRQAPGVRRAVEQHAGKVNIVGVAGLADAQAMPEFVRLAKAEGMPHIADPSGDVWKRFGIREQSVFVLLSGTGEVTFRGRLDSADVPGRVAALLG